MGLRGWGNSCRKGGFDTLPHPRPEHLKFGQKAEAIASKRTQQGMLSVEAFRPQSLGFTSS